MRQRSIDLHIIRLSAGRRLAVVSSPKRSRACFGILQGGHASRRRADPHPTRRPQIEGRGNGIKTNVVNNVDLAKALERPPECAPHPLRKPVPACIAERCVLTIFPCADVLKFFGCELGAQTKYDASTGNSIVNGALFIMLAAHLIILISFQFRWYVAVVCCGDGACMQDLCRRSE